MASSPDVGACRRESGGPVVHTDKPQRTLGDIAGLEKYSLDMLTRKDDLYFFKHSLVRHHMVWVWANQQTSPGWSKTLRETVLNKMSPGRTLNLLK